MEIVYQSSSPTCPRTLKFGKKAIEKFPSASTGTPRATLPAAAPKRIARRQLENTKTKYQRQIYWTKVLAIPRVRHRNREPIVDTPGDRICVGDGRCEITSKGGESREV